MARVKQWLAAGTLLLAAAGLLGEGRVPYDALIKAGALRKRHTVDGEACIRVYVKAKDGQAVDPSAVKIHIERNGKVLKEIALRVRQIDDDSANPDSPWEIFLPVDPKYNSGESELVHNLPPGSLVLTIAYRIKGGPGKGVPGIVND